MKTTQTPVHNQQPPGKCYGSRHHLLLGTPAIMGWSTECMLQCSICPYGNYSSSSWWQQASALRILAAASPPTNRFHVN